jgi:hypothetical protein
MNHEDNESTFGAILRRSLSSVPPESCLFKYVTMIRISLMMMFLPFVSIAQESDFSGIWMLKEKKSLNGPDYENGVPKII